MPHADHLSARQAADLLGIRRETLYAYVSRGLLRSVESGDGRARLYPRADVEKLQRRQTERRQPGKAVEGALHFGSPVLESALTLIDEGRFYYRGLEVATLSRVHSFEAIAGWLWLEDFGSGQELFASSPRRGMSPFVDSSLGAPWCLESLQAALPRFASDDPSAWAARRPRDAAAAGARLISRMVSLAAGGLWSDSVAATLAEGWGVTGTAAHQLIDAALILCADHELNVSAFTARCVASAGSPLASVVAAGLSALQGPKHGGHTRRMEALLREAGSPEGLHGAVTDRLRRGEQVPGFGQALYPKGDPRFLELVQRLRDAVADADSGLDAEVVAWSDALEGVGRDLLGEHPTVDVGLVLVARSLALPADAALSLFALGRTVGWIGHAIEQYAADRLIRPRARYIGELPRA